MTSIQPLRSARLAAKNVPVLPTSNPTQPTAIQKAMMDGISLIKSLSTIYDKNKRAEIICNVFEILINNQHIIAAYPRFRHVATDRALNVVQKSFEYINLYPENRETLIYNATKILRIISTIETHPDYVA